MNNMKVDFNDLANELKKKNIRLSHQRLKVLEYMIHKRKHPTVDQIYIDLHKEIPTLSKTTIYNTLNALLEAGIVKALNISDNETKYDIVTDDHGHFKCDVCGNIYDFHIKVDEFISEDLKDFKVRDRDVYLKGICPRCSKKKLGNSQEN